MEKRSNSLRDSICHTHLSPRHTTRQNPVIPRWIILPIRAIPYNSEWGTPGNCSNHGEVLKHPGDIKI